MLPKEEKIKKKVETSEQQPGLFDKENEKDRIRKKRRFVYIAMILTIGLSLSFWIYRSIKNFNFSFKLPDFNFTVSTPKNHANLNLSLNSNSTWSFFVKNLNSDSIIFQKNQDLIFTDQNLNSLLTRIDQNKPVSSSEYASSLPEGLKFKELIEEKDNNFSYFSKIITPSQELILIIKISDSQDLSQAKKLIPGLIDQLYWYSLQK